MRSIDILNKCSGIDDALKVFKDTSIKSLNVNGATPEVSVLFTALAFSKEPKFMLYVAPNLYKATRAYEDFTTILGADKVELFGTDEVMTVSLLGEGNELGMERLHALSSIITEEPKIIITHTLALTLPLVPLHAFKEFIVSLHKGEEINREALISLLIDNGYKREPLTQEMGTFSVRGEVIDIWPIFNENPIRLDFFDIEIEAIYSFDPVSQRRTDSKEHIAIFPLSDVVYHEEQINALSDCAKATMMRYQHYEDIVNHNHLSTTRRYIHLLYHQSETLLDYVKGAPLCFQGYMEGLQSLDNSLRQSSEYLGSIDHPNDESWEFSKPLLLPDHVIYYNLNTVLPNDIDLKSYPVIGYNYDVKAILATLNNRYSYVKHYIFTFTSLERYKLFKETLDVHQLAYSTEWDEKSLINVLFCSDSVSFNIQDYSVIGENLIYQTIHISKSKFHKAYASSSDPLKSIHDIKEGDYVVHEDYGIGQYKGIKTVTLNNISNDYLTLQYKDEILYTPVEQIGKLVIYQNSEGSVPALTSLGGDEWRKKKAKVKAKLESMAQEVAMMEAKRSQSVGYKYPEYNEMDEMFKNDAGFVETPDQLQAINDVLTDLASGKVMDRLVCGDVGFGKTEVAMRAAFKVACSHKQVAVLAPTTILARQHYETFKKRFDLFGLRVKLLCRLVSQKEQKRIKDELARGDIDVIVGTHALLAKSVTFKDLGLLVVDEEHRFGVVQKERIKHLKENVDVLSMSATPIPRTLQLALTGLRPMSLINTAPENRYPVQTYVLDYNDIVVKEAIYRELGRQGQIFYLHNHIETLDKVKYKLQRLVPEARITIVNGQMDSEDVENELVKYIEGEYDILLCTTIIENGIDMPNTNTIIIEGADHLGLSQMYQLRGRVGRSNRVAYAYFFSSPHALLTSDSEKRLGAIKEFSALGSGYQLAMRDLAIRGAGDILGAEQSGFIDSIGMDLYLKMLDEVMNHKKAEEQITVPKYNMSINKHVEEKYAGSNEMIIEIHKMINNVHNNQEYSDTRNALLDRFGTLPQDVEEYLLSIYVKYLLDERDIKFIENPLMVICNIPLKSEKNKGYKLFDYISKAKVITLDHEIKYMEEYMVLKIKRNLNDNSYLKDLKAYLEALKSVIRE